MSFASGTKVLIVDVATSPALREEFEFLGLTLADPIRLTHSFVQWEGWVQFDRAATILVFPGNGASKVRKFLSTEWLAQWRWASVPAKRYWIPGENPTAVVGRIFPERMVLGLRDVVIVDDVVSSGITCRTLHRHNSPWIPGARWHAVSWIKQRAASLPRFTGCFAAREYGTRDRRVPINSLSALLEDQGMAESYAIRNFSEPGIFLKAIRHVKGVEGIS